MLNEFGTRWSSGLTSEARAAVRPVSGGIQPLELDRRCRGRGSTRQQLRQLFDSEYLDEHGEWAPEQPYGYAPHDVHVDARVHGRVVGHAGWARREIPVGHEGVAIAGVGGVLVSDAVRGMGLGRSLMERAEQSMNDHHGVAFGYLGCREQVVAFYEACGWSRIVAHERWIGRNGAPAPMSRASRSSYDPSARRWRCGPTATSTYADVLGSPLRRRSSVPESGGPRLRPAYIPWDRPPTAVRMASRVVPLAPYAA